MNELYKLENIIENKLMEIRNKGTKTLNDKLEYRDLQEDLIKVHSVICMIKEIKDEND